ncbi:MAG: phage tail sheath family protein [Anaerolineae bacterium]|nr:phage tail sheath family protein [Anaerolineae bacterium]
MPVTPTYPGVYIEEVPSGVRTIMGVATSITAFIGCARRGKVNDPIRVQSFAEYQRIFGGLWLESPMSYAVQHFFNHGGTDAIVVRVHNNATSATLGLTAGGATLTLVASSLGSTAENPGEWGNNLRVTADHQTKDADDPYPDIKLFNLTIEELDPDSCQPVARESILNISTDRASPRYVAKVLEQESGLVAVQGTVPTTRPDAGTSTSNNNGGPGGPISDTEVTGVSGNHTGIYALDKADLFNLLCIPPLSRGEDVEEDVLQRTTILCQAASYCRDRRAMLIVDPLSSWSTVADAESGVNELRTSIGTDLSANVAAFFPRLRMADPLRENLTEDFAPCGAIAGIFAHTDAQRGVWKAPAGIEASLAGVRELSCKLTDGENGRLNPLGLNCLRTFSAYGTVVWGARTLAGADRIGSEWKYIPIRRLALYIEESLYRGTQWVVFEPNDESLWAQIRLNVGAFMHNLFRQGAFQGKTPHEAYFVKCDKETTTQTDINLGIVNVLVGFAPLKPAEFVILKIQQIAGQIQA